MKRALLAQDGTLTGFAAPTGAPGEVLVPDNCDLMPKKYRWDGKAFWPIRPDPHAVLQQHDTLVAVARGFAAVRDSGAVTLPEQTLAWLSAVETTFEE